MAEVTETDRKAANSYLSPAKERTIDGLFQAFAAHREAAEKAERQAVVDWLRTRGLRKLTEGKHSNRSDFQADAIARGDHRKG